MKQRFTGRGVSSGSIIFGLIFAVLGAFLASQAWSMRDDMAAEPTEMTMAEYLKTPATGYLKLTDCTVTLDAAVFQGDSKAMEVDYLIIPVFPVKSDSSRTSLAMVVDDPAFILAAQAKLEAENTRRRPTGIMGEQPEEARLRAFGRTGHGIEIEGVIRSDLLSADAHSKAGKLADNRLTKEFKTLKPGRPWSPGEANLALMLALLPLLLGLKMLVAGSRS